MHQLEFQTNKQNLQLAFDLAEAEFNVTKLLDPEDVDVNNPCEKSIITYVSSLYDVLSRMQPPPPPPHECRPAQVSSAEKNGIVQEYSMQYKVLHRWLTESINNKLLDSKLVLPSNFVELKSLMADLKAFQLEEYPNKHRDFSKLQATYKEVEFHYPKQLMQAMDPNEDLDSLQNLWNNLEQLIYNRESQLNKALTRFNFELFILY